MGTLGLTSSNRMVQFTGKYTRVSEENYNEFLKALGVNFVLRKAATSSTPVMEISESDGNWVMKTSTTMKSVEINTSGLSSSTMFLLSRSQILMVGPVAA